MGILRGVLNFHVQCLHEDEEYCLNCEICTYIYMIFHINKLKQTGHQLGSSKMASSQIRMLLAYANANVFPVTILCLSFAPDSFFKGVVLSLSVYDRILQFPAVVLVVVYLSSLFSAGVQKLLTEHY